MFGTSIWHESFINYVRHCLVSCVFFDNDLNVKFSTYLPYRQDLSTISISGDAKNVYCILTSALSLVFYKLEC